jgi:hypothetical protein
LHAAAACSNAGEFVSIDFGIARKYPPPPMTAALPGFDGGEVLGSGNPEMPCLRIHADTLSIRACSCGDEGSELGAPFGSRRWHECTADSNAGDRMTLGEPIRTVWPLTFGSGKFGTPWERMHLENATPDATAIAADAEVLALSVGLFELPPHPATSTPLRNATAVSNRARGEASLLLRVLYGGGIRFSFMVCIPGFAFSPGSVLRDGLFRPCFALRGRQRFVRLSRRNSAETLWRYLDHKEL